MNIDVTTIINDELSLEELSEIVKEAMAKIYCKLRDDNSIRYPIGIINSLGEKSYDVDIRLLDGELCNSGESYEYVYHL